VFNLKKYYEKENKKVRSNYEDTLLTIREICDETKNYQKVDEKKKYYHFFNATGNLILKLADYEKKLDEDYFSTNTIKELLEENNELYNELLPKNYKTSYANPAYCVKILRDKFGQLISFFYCKYRKYINYAFYHKIFKMEEYNRLFIDVFNYVKNNSLEYETLKELITKPERKNKTQEMILEVKERFDINFKYLKDIVENTDLNDLRCLFRYGKFITDNEIRTVKYLLNYSEDKLKKLSNQIAKAYINGFIKENKDISKKSIVSIIFPIGQERIIYHLAETFKKHNLEITIMYVSSTEVNKQYGYDHKFDTTLYLDKEYTSLFENSIQEASEKCRDILTIFSGVISFEKFGKPPFSPENKEECLKFTDKQQKLFQIHQNNIMKIQDKYMPRTETSFTAISFPSPEIGKNFEQIFEEILEVNMLDTEKYELIQQKLIEVLDKADYVHVKGRRDNKTDIKVKMQEIKNPDKETNFQNCGADINIPVGEVFTSPRLNGTNGILHIKETYLNGLKFIDLKLTFKDGYIVDYDCKNFDKDEENKKYIEENLLFPQKTLPLGEFAIGTNTLAYVTAKKHNIINVLPVLMIEKMGPHFAIGDTCFFLQEDKSVFNKLDNKEVTARENEKTALRKTNMHEAYTFKHTDITLPYESIEFITAITKNDEKIAIMKDGRFVAEGTEELNKPFET